MQCPAIAYSNGRRLWGRSDMDIHNVAFALGGLIGSGTAVIHGALTQRHMVEPIGAVLSEGKRLSAPIRKLVPVLLHFSTFAWLAGGIALIAAATWCGRDVKLAIGLLVGSLYLFGAVGNAWATRGRHPGWMLMAAAVLLIAYGLSGSGG
jgi:phosphate/sulfate permease